ncbi:MAG: zinc ABC transporter substrate-binding protein [Myxococcota bacterium]
MKRLFLIFAVLFSAFHLGEAEAKLLIAATIPDFASIADELGGERVETVALIRGTQDPHFVDAKPSLILKVNKADLLILAGLDLEVGWLPVLITQSRNPKIQMGASGYLDASQCIAPKDVPVAPDRAMGDVHSGGNPHYYTSPEELFKVAWAIYKKLVELDGVGSEYYERRWKDFEERYEAKLKEWNAKLEKARGTKVVVYHESWIYLIDWLGFKKEGALEPKPGIPPSPSHVARLLSSVKERRIKFLFQEIYYPTRLSEVFSQKSGAKLLVLPSMVGAREEIKNIWEKFDFIVERVTNEKEN